VGFAVTRDAWAKKKLRKARIISAQEPFKYVQFMVM